MDIGNIKEMTTLELYEIKKIITEEIDLRYEQEQDRLLKERIEFLGDNIDGRDTCASSGCRIDCSGCDFVF